MMRCDKRQCPLHGRIEVPYAGNTRAQVVWIGESPGYYEEQEGQPFIGDSGVLSKEVCQEVGLDWGSLFVMNSARCRIVKEDLGGKGVTKVLAHCREYVEAAIRHIKPKIIVTTGDMAMRQILRKQGITKARGTWIWSREFDCWVLPTFHPAYILRNMGMRPYLVMDLAEVVSAIRNEYKPIKHTEDGLHYSRVDDLKGLITAQQAAEGVSLDTETQGLDWSSPDFVPISFSVSPAYGKAFDVVLFEECPPEEGERVITAMRPEPGKKKKVPTQVGVRRAANFDMKIRQLRAILECPEVKLYMMNGNFDLHVISRLFRDLGYPTIRVANYAMDIQAAAFLLDENVHKQARLDHLQRFFTDFKADYNREFDLAHNKADMLSVPPEERSPYACADADVTRRAAMSIRRELLKKKNRKLLRYYSRFVHPTLRGLARMEEFGAWVDQEKIPKALENMKALWQAEQVKALNLAPPAVLAMEIHQTRGLRLTRDDLVRDILFHEDGFQAPVIKLTESKQPSADKEVRKTLKEQKLPGRVLKFIDHYDLWSEYYTIWSRYLKGFQKAVKPDGRIHTKYDLTIAVTGRVSSSDPNLMNIPKRSKSAPVVRSLIAAPPGKLLLAADEGQSELRWASIVAGDRAMMQVFIDGKDIHTATAMALSGKKWDTMSQAERDLARFHAKAVNFGLLYGMSVSGFITYARLEYGINLSYREAQRWVDTFFRTYPGLPQYHRRMIEFCRRHGWVETPLGRRRHLPEINSKEDRLRAEAERMAINHPIQGVSSDTVLMVNNELLSLDLNPEEFMPNLFIHDELVAEVEDGSKVEDYARLLKHHMEHPPFERDFGFTLPIPLVSDVKVGRNLMEMTKMDL